MYFHSDLEKAQKEISFFMKDSMHTKIYFKFLSVEFFN